MNNLFRIRDAVDLGEATQPRCDAAGNLLVAPAVADSAGGSFNPDSMPTTAVTRDGSGNLLTITKSDASGTWVKAITRDANGDLATESAWVKQ